MKVALLLARYTVLVVSSLQVATPVGTGSRRSRQLADCVGNITLRYFQPGWTITLDLGDDKTEEGREARGSITGRVHALSLWTVLAYSPAAGTRHKEPLSRQPRAYLLLVHGSDMSDQVTRLRDMANWNARALFLVIVATEQRTNPIERVRQLFENLWENKAANVVILTSGHKPRDPDAIDVFSWFPYHGVNCGGGVSDVTLLDTWSGEGGGGFARDTPLFTTKVPDDLHGCVVTVATFSWPPFIIYVNRPGASDDDVTFEGLEVQMVRTVAQACNFTLSFLAIPQSVRWGGRLPNGTWHGTMGSIVYGRANLTIASLINTNERMDDFDTSRYYLTNAATWIVPRAGLLPRWQSLLHIFSLWIWVLVISLWLLVSAVFWAQGTFTRGSLATCAAQALAILLGVSVDPRPRRRLFFLLYVIYCLQVNTAYQSSLVGFLTEPAYHRQITSEAQLLASDLDLGCVFGYEQFFDENDPTKKRLINCDTTEVCLERATSGDNLALVSDKAYVNYIIPASFTDNDGHPLVVLLPEDVVFYYVGMMFAKGNIFLDRFNQIIDRVNEAGLMSKWISDVSKFSKVNSTEVKKKKKKSSEPGPKRLTVSHLQGIFFILTLGLLFGVMLFVGEVVWLRVHPRAWGVLTTPVPSRPRVYATRNKRTLSYTHWRIPTRNTWR